MGVVVPLACLTKAVRVTGETAVMLADDTVNDVDVLMTAGLTVIAVAPDVEDLKVLVPA